MNEPISEEDVENFILKYVKQEQWDLVGDAEKSRFRNMTRNFLNCPELQSLLPLPDFMRCSVQDENEPGPKPAVKRKPKDNKNAPNDAKSKAPVRRNPKRQIAEVNYLEEEEPNEDRYVFCDTCEEEYLDFCSKCGMLKSLKDYPVALGTEDRAKKTVPKGVLEVRPSQIHGFGVFATRRIKKGIQMGPYKGEITKVETTNGYCWKLRDGRLIDAANETISNWMRYVNCARHVEEQNVAAFQYKGQLYYRSCKDIPTGEELLVYYGQSFAKNLGIDTKKYFQPNTEELDLDYYCCVHCKIGLSTKEYRDAHQKYCRFRPRGLCTDGYTFKCQYCKCLVVSQEFLKRHEVQCGSNLKRKQDAEKNRNWPCSYCEKKFRWKNNLKNHELLHNTENAKLYNCEKCTFKTICSSYLIQHLRRIHTRNDDNNNSNKVLMCEKCGIGFKTKRFLDCHLLKKHADMKHLISSKKYHCKFCNYNTLFTAGLKRHMNYKHNKHNAQKFYCNKCDHFFLQKSHLKRHLLVHSTAKKPFVCSKCQKDFNQKGDLDGHILHNHNEDIELMKSITYKIHSCEFCNYNTIRITDLKLHMNYKHNKQNARKFYCNKCDYFCLKKSTLKRHFLVHSTDKKPFGCSKCQKDFNHKVSLNSHILHNHNEDIDLVKLITHKIHYCQFCNYKTIVLSNLLRHNKTHNKKIP